MRRKDREITERRELLAILQAALVASIAFGGDVSYVIPMNYGVEDDKDGLCLYLHCAP